jgi:hypothetical protein
MNLEILFERKTLLVMILSGFAAFLLMLTSLTDNFFVWLIYRIMYVADTMFHELGHTIFDWAFGMPAIPSIFTLFGSEQAGGVTIALDRSWFMQAISFGVLAYGCYWIKRNYPSLLWGAIGLTLLTIGVSFTRYYRIPVLYMGHGGSIFMGGFFLFRAWEYVEACNNYKRFLKAFFGFFLVFNNMHLAYKLATDTLFRQEYTTPTFGGAIDNDFVQITDIIWRWSLQGIALFTIAYCVLALIVPMFLACYLKEDDSL